MANRSQPSNGEIQDLVKVEMLFPFLEGQEDVRDAHRHLFGTLRRKQPVYRGAFELGRDHQLGKHPFGLSVRPVASYRLVKSN